MILMPLNNRHEPPRAWARNTFNNMLYRMPQLRTHHRGSWRHCAPSYRKTRQPTGYRLTKIMISLGGDANMPIFRLVFAGTTQTFYASPGNVSAISLLVGGNLAINNIISYRSASARKRIWSAQSRPAPRVAHPDPIFDGIPAVLFHDVGLLASRSDGPFLSGCLIASAGCWGAESSLPVGSCSLLLFPAGTESFLVLLARPQALCWPVEALRYD